MLIVTIFNRNNYMLDIWIRTIYVSREIQPMTQTSIKVILKTQFQYHKALDFFSFNMDKKTHDKRVK